jgi:hypothetical protein
MNHSTITRACAIALLAALHTVSHAGPGMSCERMEYAQLKDSSRKELSEAVCSAKSKDALDQELGAIAKEQFEASVRLGGSMSAAMADMHDIGEARLSCVRAADEATKMLRKKFAAPAPSCK